jgi:hypothetical protein
VDAVGRAHFPQFLKFFRKTGCCCATGDATNIQDFEISQPLLDKSLNQFTSLLVKTSEHFFCKITVFCVGAMTCVRATTREDISGQRRNYDAGVVPLRFEDRQDMLYDFSESGNWGGDDPPPR